MRNENMLHAVLATIAALCFVILMAVLIGLHTVIAEERRIAAIKDDTEDTVVIMLPAAPVSSVCDPAPVTSERE
jgi:hypothetical protein